MLAVAGYVFAWMRVADRRSPSRAPCRPANIAGRSSADCPRISSGRERCLRRRVCCRLAVVSRECLACFGRRGSSRARRRIDARQALGVEATAVGQRALDATRSIPRDAGMHRNAADSCSTLQPSWRSQLRGAPAGRVLAASTALRGARDRAAARRGASGSPGRLAALPRACVLPVAPRRRDRLFRRGLAASAPGHGVATRAWPGLRSQHSSSRFSVRRTAPRARAIFASNHHSMTRRALSRSCPRSRSVSISRFRAALVTATRWRAVRHRAALLGVSHASRLRPVMRCCGKPASTPHVRDVRAWALAAPVLLVVGPAGA